jgi:Flp pilus assembly pilin Flp
MLELYTKLHTALHGRLAKEDGQTMAEYAIILAVISIGVILAISLLSSKIGGALSSVANQI